MDGEMQPETLEAALEASDPPVVVDIRQPGAYRDGHIPGSLNRPLPDLARGVEDLTDADHVVTVCPHGKASVKAARLIASYDGFEGRVESLHGGLTAWEGPLEREQTTDSEAPAGDGADDGPQAPF